MMIAEGSNLEMAAEIIRRTFRLLRKDAEIVGDEKLVALIDDAMIKLKPFWEYNDDKRTVSTIPQ